MASSTRIITMWTTRDAAQVRVEGRGNDEAIERLERVLDRLIRARARDVTVDLARMEGPDTAVVELLAAVCHRLWARRGCLRVAGLRDRLASSPEVAAFPEVFGEVPHPRGHSSSPGPRPAHQSRPADQLATMQVTGVRLPGQDDELTPPALEEVLGLADTVRTHQRAPHESG